MTNPLDILLTTKNPIYALIVAIGGVIATAFQGIFTIMQTFLDLTYEVFLLFPEDIRSILVVFLPFPILVVTIKFAIMIKKAVFK